MYLLKLKTGGVWLLEFDNVKNQEQSTIKVEGSKSGNQKLIQKSHELKDEIIDYEIYLIQKKNMARKKINYIKRIIDAYFMFAIQNLQ